MNRSVRAVLLVSMGVALSQCTTGYVGDEADLADSETNEEAFEELDDKAASERFTTSQLTSEQLRSRWADAFAAWRRRGGGGGTGGTTTGGTSGGTTGTTTGGTTGGTTGDTTGGTSGGTTGTTTGGTTGGTTGETTGGTTGGTTGTTPAPAPSTYSCPSAQATGVVHYVCDCGPGASSQCVAGNDGNTGSSPASPWRSFEKARAAFTNMPAGETIAFCRGGSIPTSTNSRWVNPKCQADKPCVVRDYVPSWGSASTAAPIIKSTGDVRVFSLENGGDPSHEEGYVFANLDLRGSGAGLGFFMYNDVDDVLICNTSMDRLSIGVQTQGSNPGAADTRNERIIVKGSRFTNNAGFGYLGGCDECVVEDSYFRNNGSRAVYDHNLYLHNGGNEGTPFVNMRVSRNELYQSVMVDGKCQGVSFVVHGLYDNLVIEDNYIHEDVGAVNNHCWGIAIDAADYDKEGFRNVTVRGNRLENMGGMFIGINACQNCAIDNNVIVSNQNQEIIGIMAPDRGRSDPDLLMTSVSVRNNSLYFGAGFGTGIIMGGEGANHTVTSNAIQYAGSGAFDCFDYSLPKSSYKMIDNNLCYSANTTVSWVRGVGSLASWKSSSGFDQNSAVTNPGFMSVSAPYNLSSATATSAMVGKGHATLSSPTAFGGATRSTPPDIGAYER